jgi:uridine phosphorylase
MAYDVFRIKLRNTPYAIRQRSTPMSQSYLPITGLPAGGVSPAVLVCGDPARASKIAGYLQNAHPLSEQREYRAFKGTYRDMEVVVCSHGIGAAGAAIAFEELIQAGGRWLVRIGTCGSLQPDADAGHLVVATAAVDWTGYGREIFPAGFPAVADVALTQALRQSADQSGHASSSGLVLSRDGFYEGPKNTRAADYHMLAGARVLAVEMECAALFLVAGLRSAQAAAILAVDGNVLHSGGESMANYQPHRPIIGEAVEAAIRIALEALYTCQDLPGFCKPGLQKPGRSAN